MTRLTSLPLRESFETAWYLAHKPGMPDVLAMKVPAELVAVSAYRSNDGFNGHFKLVLCESGSDLAYAERCLGEPLKIEGGVLRFKESVDKLNARRTTLAFRNIMSMHYLPPFPTWPHLVVTGWPPSMPRSVQHMLMRGAYTGGFHPTEKGADAALERVAYLAGRAGASGIEFG